MADFLNQSNGVFTSSRDDGTGKPITDVKLIDEIPAGSQIIGQVKFTDGTNGVVVNVDGSINAAIIGNVSLSELPTGNNVIGQVKQALERRGLSANKPTASLVEPGTTYWSVDTDPSGNAIEVSDGTNWVVI